MNAVEIYEQVLSTFEGNVAYVRQSFQTSYPAAGQYQGSKVQTKIL
jgi:hypothetical protein